jgi:hypothetical protein
MVFGVPSPWRNLRNAHLGVDCRTVHQDRDLQPLAAVYRNIVRVVSIEDDEVNPVTVVSVSEMQIWRRSQFPPPRTSFRICFRTISCARRAESGGFCALGAQIGAFAMAAEEAVNWKCLPSTSPVQENCAEQHGRTASDASHTERLMIMARIRLTKTR